MLVEMECPRCKFTTNIKLESLIICNRNDLLKLKFIKDDDDYILYGVCPKCYTDKDIMLLRPNRIIRDNKKRE